MFSDQTELQITVIRDNLNEATDNQQRIAMVNDDQKRLRDTYKLLIQPKPQQRCPACAGKTCSSPFSLSVQPTTLNFGFKEIIWQIDANDFQALQNVAHNFATRSNQEKICSNKKTFQNKVLAQRNTILETQLILGYKLLDNNHNGECYNFNPIRKTTKYNRLFVNEN